MKKYIFLMLVAVGVLFTSCSENYSNGKRVGTITQFSEAGLVFKTWEGHLNVTQTGMNTASSFEFSIDRDMAGKEKIIAILDSAQNLGWKVDVTYHRVRGWNWFSNRGATDYFVTNVEVLDRNFGNSFGSNPNPQALTSENRVLQKDTVYNIVITAKEAREMGIVK